MPKTRIAGGMFLKLEGSETEPIGDRIIEVPEDTERTETLRDPRSGFIAYVPVGSIKKGEALVTTGGGGKTTRCAVCHGADLKGLGPVPGIAGRSPSYTVRQLFDMQQRHAQRRVGRSDEAGRREPDERGHAGDRRVHGVADAVDARPHNRRARRDPQRNDVWAYSAGPAATSASALARGIVHSRRISSPTFTV